MDILNGLGSFWHFSARFLVDFYGWVIFLAGAIYMAYFSYKHEIQHQYIHLQEWEFLNIRVPKVNMQSTLGVESIFGQMHSLHGGKTFADIYAEGQTQLWYSLELVSLGGKISFILRIPKKMRNVVEAAIYSQYPQAEITETEDYLKNLNYDPEGTPDLEIFATEMKIEEDDVIPIKTYKDFEHQAAEEKIIDPLSNLFESLSKVEEHELLAIQILTRPLDDAEWKPRGEAKVKQLIGEKPEHHATLGGLITKPLNWAADVNFAEMLAGGGHGHQEQSSQKNNWMSMTETEKLRVTLIEKKIGKPGFQTKIRMLYLAPKASFDTMKRNMIFGAYRNLGSVMTNKFKPSTKNWTGIDHSFSKTLEEPYLTYRLFQRKRRMFKAFKERALTVGIAPFIMNVEELATLYHFPITAKDATVSTNIEKTDSKKYQPPVDLPIADIY